MHHGGHAAQVLRQRLELAHSLAHQYALTEGLRDALPFAHSRDQQYLVVSREGKAKAAVGAEGDSTTIAGLMLPESAAERPLGGDPTRKAAEPTKAPRSSVAYSMAVGL